MKSWMKAAGPHSWGFMFSFLLHNKHAIKYATLAASHCRFSHVYPVFYSDLTCVFESGRSQGTVPFRLSSAILALSLWARTMVRGMHSSVSSVAYPNIRPCPRSTSTVKEQHFIFWRRKNWCFSPELKCKRSDDLVSSSDFALHAIDMNSLSDVRWLLLQGYQHVTGLIIKSLEKQRKKKKRDVFVWKHFSSLESQCRWSYSQNVKNFTHLSASHRNQYAGWLLSPLSGSPRWLETWSPHRAAPCPSYTPSLFHPHTGHHTAYVYSCHQMWMSFLAIDVILLVSWIKVNWIAWEVMFFCQDHCC